MGKKVRGSAKAGLIIIGFPIYAWSLIAIYYLPTLFPWIWLRITLMIIMGAGIPVALFIFKSNKQSLLASYASFALIIILFSFKTPSNDRDWAVSVDRLPLVTINKNLITVKNVRNFNYRSPEDFDIRYYKKTYDVDKLETLWLALSYWDGHKDIAHAIFSFGFANGDYLVVSSEVRLQKGKEMSELGGIFKECEIIYILTDETDVLKLRTNYRKEEVFLYEITPKKGIVDIREFFLHLMDIIKGLETQPQFYNTITNNCLTSLLHDFSVALDRNIRFDIRIIKNGYFDELLYERKVIKTWGLPFKELKQQRHINQYVEDDPSNYSIKIRKPPEGGEEVLKF